MSEIAPSAPKEARRERLVVSVRALMLLVLAVGLGLGWKINRAGTQKRAVARIEKAGGSVIYDYTFDGTYPYKPIESPGVPAWLRARLGDEFFQEVTAVSFYKPVTDDQLAPVADFDRLLALELHGTKVTNAGLAHLANLKNLREIRLDRTQITDAVLARLRPLTGLRRLDLQQEGLSMKEIQTEEVRKIFEELENLTHNQKVGEVLRRRGTAITDAGLAQLASLTGLQELRIALPAITDAGFAHVGRLADLRVLHVYNTDFSDASLAHLAGLTGLRNLSLWGTRISDAGLAHLKPLDRLEVLDLQHSIDVTDQGLSCLENRKTLRELDLSGTMVSDAGLAHLTGLSGLQKLDLSENEITDAGLAYLRNLRQLRQLDLDNTKVTGEGVTALVETLPALKVSRRNNLLFAGFSARKERAFRKWTEDTKKSHEDMKQWMKEYNSPGGATRPLPPPPSLPPIE